jgi:hypothetical protein
MEIERKATCGIAPFRTSSIDKSFGQKMVFRHEFADENSRRKMSVRKQEDKAT